MGRQTPLRVGTVHVVTSANEQDNQQDCLKPPGSRVLHAVDRLASRPGLAFAIVAADLLWLGFSALVGFPSRLETIFQTLVAGLTLAMVFVIQHTQSREQAVTQRKLDELLWALPGADNALITLEDAPDHDLNRATHTHRAARTQALSPDSTSADARA